jgi:hypothetical protein
LVVGGALGVFRREIAGNLTPIIQRVAIAWPIAAVIGLVARNLVVGHGLEISFIIVTIFTNLVILLAWRTAYALVLRTKRQEASS